MRQATVELHNESRGWHTSQLSGVPGVAIEPAPPVGGGEVRRRRVDRCSRVLITAAEQDVRVSLVRSVLFCIRRVSRFARSLISTIGSTVRSSPRSEPASTIGSCTVRSGGTFRANASSSANRTAKLCDDSCITGRARTLARCLSRLLSSSLVHGQCSGSPARTTSSPVPSQRPLRGPLVITASRKSERCGSGARSEALRRHSTTHSSAVRQWAGRGFSGTC
jgi:hypothetical protein